jgi:hypothetical protein
MAPAFILIGSVAGFMGGLFAFFVLEFGLLAALAVWLLSGPASAVVAVSATGRSAARTRVNRQQAPVRLA